MRMLVAWYPDWPVVAAGCSPDVPAAVVRANQVVAVTAAGRAEGVRPGLRRREAQGRCPELIVVLADAGRDARAWEPVVVALETLTPAVEILAPGAAALATRGPSRYFGGDEALAIRVAEEVDRVVGQPGCRVGIADGRFTAGLAARAARVAPNTGDRGVTVRASRGQPGLAGPPPGRGPGNRVRGAVRSAGAVGDPHAGRPGRPARTVGAGAFRADRGGRPQPGERS